MAPLFVFPADLHLADGAWSTKPGIYGDAYYSFSQIVDYCIAHDLPLILGGDILEKKSNSARPIVKLCEGLSQMQAAGVPVFYIQGNHEYDRNAPWLSVHPWPIHMHKTARVINDVRVYGLDWLPRGEIQTAFEEVPAEIDILLTHQVWKDFMGEIGRTECELTDVHFVQTVLAGDFHVTKVVEGVNAQGKPIKMLSPGSTAMQDMGETEEKFFFVISRDSSTGVIDFTPVPLKTRGVVRHVVKDQDTLDSLCAGQLAKEIAELVARAQAEDYPQDIQKPLVRVKFDKRLPDAFVRISTTVGDSAHLFCEALAERSGARPQASRNASKNDLLSAVAELLPEESAAYSLAAALLGADNLNKELAEQFSLFMDEEPHATSETGSEELGSSSPTDV